MESETGTGATDVDIQGPRTIEVQTESTEAVRPLVDGTPSGGTGTLLEDIDPSTGEAFARIACGGPEDVDRAAESAAFSSALWRGASFEERGARLRKMAELLRAQSGQIAELIAREQGKPRHEAIFPGRGP